MITYSVEITANY